MPSSVRQLPPYMALQRTPGIKKEKKKAPPKRGIRAAFIYTYCINIPIFGPREKGLPDLIARLTEVGVKPNA